MIRNLKALGLALVAVFAMSAMATSVASAEFTTTSGAKLTATDSNGVKFTVTGQEVTCNEAVFSGTAPAASFESISVSAVYNECKTGLGTSVTVTGMGQFGEANKCVFTLHTTGKADLHCTGGADVTVDAGPCVVHIPEQTGLGTISYTTHLTPAPNAKHALLLHLDIKNITAAHTDGFLCPFGSSGEATGAELHGTVTATATSGGSLVDLTHDL